MFSYRIIIFISKFYITQYFYLINKNYKWNWYNINGIVLWQKTWIFNKKVEVDIDSKFQQQKKTCKNIVMHSHDMWDIFHSKIDLTWHIFLNIFCTYPPGSFKGWNSLNVRKLHCDLRSLLDVAILQYWVNRLWRIIFLKWYFKNNSILDTYELFELRIEFHIFGL